MRSAVAALSLALSFGSLALVACGSEPLGPPESEFLPVRDEPQAPGKPPAGDFPGDGDGSSLSACATGATTVVREPANALLLIDRSGSMHIELPTGQTRWEATKTGLFDLLGALPSKTEVGAMMFPQGDAPVNASCGIDPAVNDVRCTPGWSVPSEAARCSAATYTAGVPAAPLTSSQVKAIQDHVTASDSEFYWGTPLAPALTAAISSQKSPSIEGARSVILLTDGNPTSCTQSGITNDIQHVVEAAAAGTADTLVRTFVIGVIDDARQAAKAENLSPVAVAGGTARFAGCEATNECFYAVTAANFAADIHKVFEDISLQAFDCTFPVPEPPPGSSADPASVNVEVTGAGKPYVVPRDENHQNGWDYLPGGKQLQVYGEACKKLAEDGGKVSVVVGCRTQIR
jgi:hypothetical protein